MMKMNKIRGILAGAAVCLAGIGVYANTNAVATSYYRTTVNGAPVCTTLYTGALCPTGNIKQCSVAVDDVTYWITKVVDSAPCALHMRN